MELAPYARRLFHVDYGEEANENTSNLGREASIELFGHDCHRRPDPPMSWQYPKPLVRPCVGLVVDIIASEYQLIA